VTADGFTDPVVDFTTPDANVWPPAWEERDFWMLTEPGAKNGRAPWADTENRASWSNPENWASKETVDTWVEKEPALGHIAILDRESDPYTDNPDPFAFVDGDKVRCPETGEVHPEFITILDRLGLTYADISTSGTGVHALYKGRYPDWYAGKQIVFEIDDDAWGANEEPPSVEIYEGNKVCKATGKHVPGTPLEVAEWDTDTLGSVIEEYMDPRDITREPETTPDTAMGQEDLPAQPADARHVAESGQSWLEDYDPDVTGMEITHTLADVLHAVSQLDAHSLPLETHCTGTDSTGWETYDPSPYRTSASGESLHSPDGRVFHDHKTGQSFNAFALFAAEQGCIQKPWHPLTGAEFWTAVDRAREAGAAIPRFVPGSPSAGDYEYEYDPATVTILPVTRRTQNLKASWNYMGEPEPTITQDDVHDRVEQTIRDAVRQGDHALIDAIMSSGKTYSTFKVGGDLGEPLSVFTNTTDLREEEMADYCDEHGLDAVHLPAADRDCPAYQGEYGEDLADDLRRQRDQQQVTPQEQHEQQDLPCEAHPEGCPYRNRWAAVNKMLEEDAVDVVLGHYNHAHLDHLVIDRVAVFDEDPSDAYTTALHGDRLQQAVTAFCQHYDDFPFVDFLDLLSNRRDPDRLREAQDWFDQFEFTRDPTPCFADDNYHAYAPHAAATILFASPAGDARQDYPFERAVLPDEDRHTALFSRGSSGDSFAVELQNPPDLPHPRAILALDGTPDPTPWDRALGTDLTHREVLSSDAEKRDYLRNTLGLTVLDLSDGYTKPTSSGVWANPDRVRATCSEIAREYDHAPVVFDTAQALRKYRGDDLQAEDGGPVKEMDNFANIRGKDSYGSERVAVIGGSPHYGDAWVQKQAAWDGVAVYREGKGADLSYCTRDGDPYGDRYLWQMREAAVAQAALRVGRDGNGAVIATLTSAYPDWLPVEGHGSVVRTWTAHQQDILRAIAALAQYGDAITAPDVADHPTVDCCKRWVLEVLRDFEQLGYLDAERPGRSIEFVGDGLHYVNPDGQVELPTVDLPEDPGEDSEQPLTTLYKASFRLSPDLATVDGPPDGHLSVNVQPEDPVTASDDPPPD